METVKQPKSQQEPANSNVDPGCVARYGRKVDTRLERFSPLGGKLVYYIYWKDVSKVWIKNGIGVDRCLRLILNCDQPINVKYVEDVLGERVDC